MKTDPTAGVTGTPLSYQAVASGNQSAQQSNLKCKPKIAISDLVETSDREGDGRQPLEVSEKKSPVTSSIVAPRSDENGGLLDLTG